MLYRSVFAGCAPGSEHVVGNRELPRFQAELVPRGLDLILAKRRAVSRGGALLIRGTVTDDRAATDQARPWIGDRFPDCPAHVVRVEAIAFGRVPLSRLMPGNHVLVARQFGRAVDGDAVVVPQNDQPS